MTQGMVWRYCITCDKAHIHVYHQHNCHTDTSRDTNQTQNIYKNFLETIITKQT